jgi:uncharacterized membrane protein HdeD (DUF308 family)
MRPEVRRVMRLRWLSTLLLAAGVIVIINAAITTASAARTVGEIVGGVVLIVLSVSVRRKSDQRAAVLSAQATDRRDGASRDVEKKVG